MTNEQGRRPILDLFVYGTLLSDDIVRALTNRTFRSQAAVLRGFSRHGILRGGAPAAYPAIKPNPSGVVSGRVLLDVDARSLEWIERFESDPPDYERQQVEVAYPDGMLALATTYVARPTLIPSLHDHWDLREFERLHLAAYVNCVIPEMRRCVRS